MFIKVLRVIASNKSRKVEKAAPVPRQSHVFSVSLNEKEKANLVKQCSTFCYIITSNNIWNCKI